MIEEQALFIIAELVSRLESKAIDLGKIQLQKLVYFLEELGAPLQYEFRIYHYGPFCSELAEDIDRLNTLGVLSVKPDSEGYGYHISTGQYYESMMKDSNQRGDQELSGKIDTVIDKFSGFNPSEIELLATIHFVKQISQDNNEQTDKGSIVNTVHKLKPKFSAEEISSEYDELQSTFPN